VLSLLHLHGLQAAAQPVQALLYLPFAAADPEHLRLTLLLVLVLVLVLVLGLLLLLHTMQPSLL
jgi:hypothetical protein